MPVSTSAPCIPSTPAGARRCGCISAAAPTAGRRLPSSAGPTCRRNVTRADEPAGRRARRPDREGTCIMEPTAEDDLTGRTVEQYAIVALVAIGGQGTVYRGRDQRLHRDVAIKVLRGCGGDAPPRHQLIREARVLSRLNHPHVAGVYDFVTHGKRDFIVMEFVPGATLRDILAGGP